jgi:hypothetical protein
VNHKQADDCSLPSLFSFVGVVFFSFVGVVFAVTLLSRSTNLFCLVDVMMFTHNIGQDIAEV